ncbi:SRPBCC family protein [Rathayibacter sp. VKM Ac-2805]|uniref:SRPBCC family protein n=1 Tax=Rathayibacter sp. VKM Ac-2805 TaxID=2609258 RepID=UPI0013202E75|nr:SRPBCC family protein [Rathayibacter sp. VKM Ac-2805]QHC74756.1 hypothetical protein GSU40_14320 [Rathayibacter sp. VKM Ac-2805]
MTFTAIRIVDCAAPIVLEVLRDARSLAAWNPALGTLRPSDRHAVVGRSYRTVIRGVLPAVVTFTRIDEIIVDYRMNAFGAEESGSWIVEPLGEARARVTHSFTHKGALLDLFRRSFAPVASRRLDRLVREFLVT